MSRMSSIPPSEPRESQATSFFSRFTSGFGGNNIQRNTEQSNRQSELPSEFPSEMPSESQFESQPYSENAEGQYYESGLEENYPASSARTDSVFIRAP